MTAIADVRARQIFDSRGNPTVEVDVRLESGALGRAAVPSGASTGVHEAVELRDGGDAYGGKGVTQAVANVNGEIAAAVKGREATDQAGLDQALLRPRRHAEQIAAGRERRARRLARDREGGRRGGGGLALPLPRRRRRARPAGADDERDQRRCPRGQHDRPPGVHGRPGRRVELRRGDADRDGGLPLAEVGVSTNAASRRRSATRAASRPDLASSEEAIEAILEAAERAGHRERVAIALDPASTEFFADGVYRFEGREADGAAMADFYAGLAERYPLVSDRGRRWPRTTGARGGR